MSMVSGVFSVVCDECGTQHDFTAADVDFEGGGGEEKQMGPENLYVWKEAFECGECGNDIEIEYTVSEYPAGAFNHADPSVEGAQVVSEFDFEFIDHDDDDYDGRDEDEQTDDSEEEDSKGHPFDL